MDHYHIWCDPKPGVGDVELCERNDRFLGALAADGAIRGHRIARRKLGLGPLSLGELHVQIDVDDLAQLDLAFGRAATRAGAIEELHAAVNQHAANLTFALYRDFPDPVRVRGEERFGSEATR
jgi:hypothetical protein